MQQTTTKPLTPELLDKHPFALQCFHEVYRNNKREEFFRTDENLIPLASGSKAIMGFATMLFLYEKLENTQKADETGTRENFLPHTITIKQLLENRKTDLENKIKEMEDKGLDTKILHKKLTGIEAYLEYAKNEVFANTTIKSLLNHTSKMGSVHFEDDKIADSEDEHKIDPAKFVSFLESYENLESHEKCFDSANSEAFKYNNKAYALLGSIMDLMTDNKDGFMAEINRYAKKIGAEFFSYHELGDDVLAGQNFRGTHKFERDFKCFADRNIFFLEGLGCSYASGGTCGTARNTFNFFSVIGDFYSGNEKNLFMELIPAGKDGKRPNGLDIFKNFSAPKPEPTKGPDTEEHKTKVAVVRESSLGFYRETREGITRLYRDGVLPLFELYVEINITKDGKEITFVAYHEDVYLGFINFAKRVMLDRGDLFELVGKISKDDIQNFKKDFKEKLIELKSQSEEEKKYIAERIRKVLNIVAIENTADKTIKIIELQKELKEFEVSDKPILKIFATFVNTQLQKNQSITGVSR